MTEVEMNALDQNSLDSAAPTILVVDDNKGILDFLLLLLSKHQLIAVGASSGHECLEIVQSRRVDLIILDVMMPVMDGLEVCQELRKIAPSVPVILLTARDDMMTRAAAMDLGVSEFVAKPVNNRDLLNRVRTQLQNLELAKVNDQAFAEIEKTTRTPGNKP